MKDKCGDKQTKGHLVREKQAEKRKKKGETEREMMMMMRSLTSERRSYNFSF